MKIKFVTTELCRAAEPEINMDNPKMQACPFCGWLETPSEKAEHIIVDGAHCLQCRRCKAVGPQTFDANGTVAYWNKRAGGEQPA